MGRPRKTKAELERLGTFRKHRHTGPDLRLEIPPMPPDLTATEQAMWHKVLNHIEYMGIVTRVDDVALRVLCKQWSILHEAAEEIERHGVLIEEHTEKSYRLKENPACKSLDRAHGRIVDILKQFGLTPASRTGLKAIHVSSDADADASLDKILGLN